jgi:hypothetical protein
MASATVNDYLLTNELTLVTAPAVLGAELSLRSGPTQRADRSFYDTFDGRLRAAGMVCVAEGERLTLLRGDWVPGREIAAITLESSRERLLPIELPQGAMRDALLPVVEVRALALLARVRSRVRTLAVLDDQQKTVLRIAIEQPTVVRSSRRSGCAPRPGRCSTRRSAPRVASPVGSRRRSSRHSAARCGRTPPPRPCCAACSR